MIMYDTWTEVDGSGRPNGWTLHLMVQALGRLMDGFGQRTIRNIEMWTVVDGLSGGLKFVREGLV